MEECFGECPYLVAELGIAYIRGMQGGNPEDGLQAGKLACMLKVMAGYEVPRTVNPPSMTNVAPVIQSA